MKDDTEFCIEDAPMFLLKNIIMDVIIGGRSITRIGGTFLFKKLIHEVSQKKLKLKVII